MHSVGSEVIIRLKWGQTEYKGSLESIDSYMNVLLRDTEEFIDGKQTGALGLVLIRYESHWHMREMSSWLMNITGATTFSGWAQPTAWK